MAFTVSRVGPFSELLHGLRRGDELWYRGPVGTGFSSSPGSALLVGGGYGCAPLLFLASSILGRGAGSAAEVVIGARAAGDVLFEGRFKSLGVRTHVTTEDGSTGTRGLATDTARALLATGRFDRLCACGPEGMLEVLASICRERAIRAELSYEAYMRCGIGICGSCEHGGRLVCLDGPVHLLEGSRK